MKRDSMWMVLTLAAVVAAILVYTRQGGFETPSPSDSIPEFEAARAGLPDRYLYCRSLSGVVETRLADCLKELASRPRLSKDARAVIADVAESGDVLFVGGTADSSRNERAIEGQEALLGVLMGTDEREASEALREAGYRGIVVHRDLVGALDRDARVLSRLAHHDHLEWFQLRHVAEERLIYTVRRSSSRVPLATGESLLVGLRQRLQGERAAPQAWQPDSVRMIGVIRLQGRALAMRFVGGTRIDGVLDQMAEKLASRWEREIEVLGMGRLADRLAEARLEVHVVMETAPVEPRSRAEIADLWEMGVDGVLFQRGTEGDDNKFSFLPGSELVTRSMKTADELLQEAVKQGGWRDRRPWEDESTELEILRTEHFMERNPGGGPAVRLVRGLPEVGMDEITDEGLRVMLVDGGEWWLRNMYPDGRILYKYWPSQNRRSTEYNEVRHILAARDLAATWPYRPDPRYLEGSRRTMDWLLKYEVTDRGPSDPVLSGPPDGTILFRYNNNQKLGTVAVALLGWIEWAKATGSHAEDERIRKMARFVQSMSEADGRFTPYFVPPGHPYADERNDIVPGEAALALGEVAEYFGEPEWLDFMPKFLDYYTKWWRARAPRTNPYGRWPHDTYDNTIRLELVQFGPWAVMATRQYYLVTGDEEAAAFGLEIADWMIGSYQWSSDRAPFPDYVGGYYKIPEELPAMQTFCYAEGTAAAYRIATRFRPESKHLYERATRESLRFLAVMQYDELDTYAAARPEIIHGGVKYAMNEDKVRIDYVGHAMSTLAQYLEARAEDPDVRLHLEPLPVPEGGAPFRTSFALTTIEAEFGPGADAERGEGEAEESEDGE